LLRKWIKGRAVLLWTDLWRGDRNRPTKARKAIYHGSPHLRFSYLAIKVACHDAFDKEFKAAHLDLDLGATATGNGNGFVVEGQTTPCPARD